MSFEFSQCQERWGKGRWQVTSPWIIYKTSHLELISLTYFLTTLYYRTYYSIVLHSEYPVTFMFVSLSYHIKRNLKQGSWSIHPLISHSAWNCATLWRNSIHLVQLLGRQNKQASTQNRCGEFWGQPTFYTFVGNCTFWLGSYTIIYFPFMFRSFTIMRIFVFFMNFYWKLERIIDLYI